MSSSSKDLVAPWVLFEKIPQRPGSETQGGVHLAIGIFDGVHLGHQGLIGAAVHAAHAQGGLAGVLTFVPHPSRIVHPENPTALLMPPEQKVDFLKKLGVDLVIQQPFDELLAHRSPKEFVALLKARLPGLRCIYVGANFRFGHGRVGDVHCLRTEAQALGVATVSMPRLLHNEVPISSSLIREKIVSGDIEVANALLGYPYYSEGPVITGHQLGRTFGVPTLNFPWEPECRPRYGVYGVSLVSKDLPPSHGIANYGVRPTLGVEGAPLLEVHLFAPPLRPIDYARVEWNCFIRPERKFASLEALVVQIQKDKEVARAQVPII